MKTDICMIRHNTVTMDGRVMNEARSLARAGFRVSAVGLALSDADLPEEEWSTGLEVLHIRPRVLRGAGSGTWVKLLRMLACVPRTIVTLRRANARSYHAHDFTGLLLLWISGLSKRTFVYDSHELFFDRWFPGRSYPLKHLIYRLRPLERWLARRAARIVTVGERTAAHLKDTLNVDRIVVIRNAFDLGEAASSGIRFDVGEGERIIVHSGHLQTGRRLELVIQALLLLPRNIKLVLLGDGHRREELHTLAVSLGVKERVHFVRPVPREAVPNTLAQASCAVMVFDTCLLNNRYSLPYKFFEAVSAGLPIVAGGSVEVGAMVEEYGLGVTCSPVTPETIAEAVRRVLAPEHHTALRDQVLASRKELCWEMEEGKLIGMYRDLLGDPRE